MWHVWDHSHTELGILLAYQRSMHFVFTYIIILCKFYKYQKNTVLYFVIQTVKIRENQNTKLDYNDLIYIAYLRYILHIVKKYK